MDFFFFNRIKTCTASAKSTKHLYVFRLFELKGFLKQKMNAQQILCKDIRERSIKCSHFQIQCYTFFLIKTLNNG